MFKEKYFEAKQLNINRTSEQNQMILEGLKLIKDCLETEFCLEEEG